MQITIIGLGKMGFGIAKRLLKAKHKVTGYNRSPQATKKLQRNGAKGAYSLQEALEKQGAKNRIVWLMIPHQAVDATLKGLRPYLKKGDVIVDGGNSYYKDTLRRGDDLEKLGVEYVDCGVSGGLIGATQGYCMMYGGSESVCKKLQPIFKALAIKDGHVRTGPRGSGHYVKMVHNGIEYGAMQAYAEGFELLKYTKQFGQLDLPSISKMWNHGSIIQSFLLEKANEALKKDPQLKNLKPSVADTGEGRWTSIAAIENGVSTPVLTQALYARFKSRDKKQFGNKLLAAIRHEFGGHAVKKK